MADSAGPSDAAIDGIEPENYLPLKGTVSLTLVPGMPSDTITRLRGTYYKCDCTTFMIVNQRKEPQLRDCEHLQHFLGESYNRARISKARETLEGEQKKSEPEHLPYQTQSEAGPSTQTSSSSQPSPGKRKRGMERDHSFTQSTSQSLRKVNPPQLLLSKLKPVKFNPVGWWMSEKLDGVRAYWDGEKIISRQGLMYWAPDAFLERLPKDLRLDGEIWIKRDCFNAVSGLARSQGAKERGKSASQEIEWDNVIYFVFDVCGLDDVVEARWDLLQKRFGPWMTPDEALKQKKGCVRVLKQVRCKSEDHLKQVHASILAKGGEGTMLRQPRSFYQHGRSKSSFKVKDTYDGTATVVGYKAGEGKHTGRTGSLNVKMKYGLVFGVGSGMSDDDRKRPPPIGTIIKYSCSSLTPTRVPRHPVYLGIYDPEFPQVTDSA